MAAMAEGKEGQVRMMVMRIDWSFATRMGEWSLTCFVVLESIGSDCVLYLGADQ
jgi:hypothetical protein